MTALNILTVVGARPQFIKAAAVSRVLRSQDGVSETLVHTGQHYDDNMSDIFFRELDIPAPDLNLGVGSGSHAEQTAAMLTGLERAMLDVSPDWVLIYGDTNSTLAAALAAAKLHIPVAHVEAGLRSFNRKMPEEINRIVADELSTLCFAPTEDAVSHLRNEGIGEDRIVRTGDVMYDAWLYYRNRIEGQSISLPAEATRGAYALATLHRAETTDIPDRLIAALEGLNRAGDALDIDVILPLHPRTRHTIERLGFETCSLTKLNLIDPVGYLDMIALQIGARVIATDSGGLQKEAFFAGVPCVTLRDETEWTELVRHEWNRLAPPTDAERVAQAIIAAATAGPPDEKPPLYGDGHASDTIAAALGRSATTPMPSSA